MTDLNVDKLTPPPELVQQWCYQDGDAIRTSPRWYQILCAKAARWGADQELEACCEYIADHGKWFATPEFRLAELRTARRPQPPSLKEQALEAQQRMWDGKSTHADWGLVRRALEALPND
jgi:hypothetical protein